LAKIRINRFKCLTALDNITMVEENTTYRDTANESIFTVEKVENGKVHYNVGQSGTLRSGNRTEDKRSFENWQMKGVIVEVGD
jgi:hypothetical protein